MSDLSYSITDDSTDPAEVVADGLSRKMAIRTLLLQDAPLHWQYVTCWDESTVEEDGTHPIEWQKSGEEFLHDVFQIPAVQTAAQAPVKELIKAAEEALECIPDLEFPAGAPESDDPLYEGLREASRYTEAVRARLNAVLDVFETDEERVVSVRSLRQLITDRIFAIWLQQTESERRRMLGVLEGQWRSNETNPYREAVENRDLSGLDFAQLGTLLEAIEAAQEPSADDSTDSLTQTTQDNGER